MIARLLHKIQSDLTEDIENLRETALSEKVNDQALGIVRGKYIMAMQVLRTIEEGLVEPEGFEEDE